MVTRPDVRLMLVQFIHFLLRQQTKFEYQIQWGSSYRTCPVFKWSKVVRASNGPLTEWWSEYRTSSPLTEWWSEYQAFGLLNEWSDHLVNGLKAHNLHGI